MTMTYHTSFDEYCEFPVSQFPEQQDYMIITARKKAHMRQDSNVCMQLIYISQVFIFKILSLKGE